MDKDAMISDLERQLEEARSAVDHNIQEITRLLLQNTSLQVQLYEARAEVERCNQTITKLSKEKYEARQSVARECSKIVHNLGCTYSLDSLERTLLVRAADLINCKFGLEG